MSQKKDRSGFMFIIALICLVVSSGASIYLDKTTSSLATDAKVLSAAPNEAAIVTEADYAEGALTVNMQTNLPTGSYLTVYADYPGLSELAVEYVPVKRGVASASFEVSEDLEPALIGSYTAFQMVEEHNIQNDSLIKRYGVDGHQMKGQNVYLNQEGTEIIAESNMAIAFYPSEDVVKPLLTEQFEAGMNALLLNNPQLLYAIEPSADKGWEEITVTLSDLAGEVLTQLDSSMLFEEIYTLLNDASKGYFIVDEDTSVKVTINDYNGNVLDTNY